MKTHWRVVVAEALLVSSLECHSNANGVGEHEREYAGIGAIRQALGTHKASLRTAHPFGELVLLAWALRIEGFVYRFHRISLHDPGHFSPRLSTASALRMAGRRRYRVFLGNGLGHAWASSRASTACSTASIAQLIFPAASSIAWPRSVCCKPFAQVVGAFLFFLLQMLYAVAQTLQLRGESGQLLAASVDDGFVILQQLGHARR